MRLAVALLTFIIGVGASSLWSLSHLATRVKSRIEAPLSSSPEPGKERVSVSNLSISGESSFSTSETFADGTTVEETSMSYSSPVTAQRELQERLEDAVEIIKREPVLNKKGQQVGERVLATFAPDFGASTVWAELLSTNGSELTTRRDPAVDKMLDDYRSTQRSKR